MIFKILQIISIVIFIYNGLLFINISVRQSNQSNLQVTSRNTNLLFALSSLNYGIYVALSIFRVQQQDIAHVVNIFKVETFFDMVAGTLWILMIASYTQVKPRRLLWLVCSVYFVMAILNLFLPYGTIFLEITGLLEANLPWGETTFYLRGPTHPLVIVGALNNLIIYVYLIYAVWKQYQQRKLYKALVLSITVLIVIVSATHIYLVDLQILKGFNTLPFAFLLTVIIMSFQLSQDIVSTQLRLEYYNKHLKDIVTLRTQELKKAIQKNTLLEERSRIAEKIHNSVNQTLHSLTMIADTLPKLWQTHPEEIIPGLNAIKRMSKICTKEIRTVILDLSPHTFSKKTLSNLIRELLQKITYNHDLQITICVKEKHSQLPEEIKILAYQIIEEGLNNIIRHSQATHAEIHLDCTHLNFSQDQLKILIKDDGIGFNPDQILPDHLGLNFLKQSCEKIGAKFTIISQPNQGTKILFECAIANQEESL